MKINNGHPKLYLEMLDVLTDIITRNSGEFRFSVSETTFTWTSYMKKGCTFICSYTGKSIKYALINRAREKVYYDVLRTDNEETVSEFFLLMKERFYQYSMFSKPSNGEGIINEDLKRMSYFAISIVASSYAYNTLRDKIYLLTYPGGIDFKSDSSVLTEFTPLRLRKEGYELRPHPRLLEKENREYSTTVENYLPILEFLTSALKDKKGEKF